MLIVFFEDDTIEFEAFKCLIEELFVCRFVKSSRICRTRQIVAVITQNHNDSAYVLMILAYSWIGYHWKTISDVNIEASTGA